jgi:hypothetical protein
MVMKLRWALALGCAVLAGCGVGQPKRAPLHGKVTYEGTPVAFGVLIFTPDAARGNKGVFGTAEIRDGVYETSPDYGPTPGPMLVNIQVYDARPPDNRMVALIPDYPVEIGSGTSSWDFNLTAGDVKPIRP